MKFLFVFLCFSFRLSAALHVGFYHKTCPDAENIVRRVVQQRFAVDKSVTAALLRMHFHDCFVRGCDASILIDSTTTKQAEKDATPNTTVREFTLIDQIKAELEATCPQIVSCADIITLATRDAVVLAGGPKYSVPTGRRDGVISKMSDVNLPGPTMTVSQALLFFTTRGLLINDMIVLLGAHTVGVAHCKFFEDRLTDPTMNKELVTKLKRICGSRNNTSFLDQNTPFVFDNQYYNQIRNNRGVMRIDQELALDPLSSNLVSDLANSSCFFGHSFVTSIIKMGNIQVLQGNDGEIRKSCRVVNKNS